MSDENSDIIHEVTSTDIKEARLGLLQFFCNHHPDAIVAIEKQSWQNKETHSLPLKIIITLDYTKHQQNTSKDLSTELQKYCQDDPSHLHKYDVVAEFAINPHTPLLIEVTVHVNELNDLDVIAALSQIVVGGEYCPTIDGVCDETNHEKLCRKGGEVFYETKILEYGTQEFADYHDHAA